MEFVKFSRGIKNRLALETDEDAVGAAYEALAELEPDQAQEVLAAAIAGLTEAALAVADEDDGPDFAILKIDKDGEKVVMREFENKKKCKKRFKKAVEKECAVVMVKGGEIYEGKCHGGNKKVAFLVGTAYGRGWVSNFGPLEDEESDYQIFEGEDSEDEDEDDDEEDDDDEEEDDDLFHLIQVTKNGEGIKDIELEEGKKARKRFKRKQNKGRVCILVKGGKVKKYSDPEGVGDVGENMAKKQLCFLIGVAYGKGLLEELGPLEDEESGFDIFDEDVDLDEVEEWE